MRYLFILSIFIISGSLIAQTKIPSKYSQGKSKIYQKGWIDLNKNGIQDTYENPNLPIEVRIDDLLSQMNSDEKTCQMVTLYGYKRVLKDDLPTPNWKNELWKDGMGAIDEHLNGFQQWGLPPSDNQYVWPASKHAWALNEVQRFFIEETRLGIPVDFTNEGIRGVESYKATNFPTQLNIGHTWNKELVRKIGELEGKEARALGYTNVYAPILDVGRDQRWGRYEEVYGESPYLVATLGTEMAKGLQKDYQVAATAKHFIAYSNNKGAREWLARVDPQMSPREVEMVHVMPFKRVIQDAGILGVMCSYNDYNGEPIAASKYWMIDRLRNDFGFEGYVVSDSEALEHLYSKHGVAKDMKGAVLQSIEAGMNMRCTFRSPESFVYPLRELIDEGAISMETIDERVRDILRVKFKLGLFDSPYQTNLTEADKIVNCEEHQAISLQASRESIVLLKNENKTLPLDISAIERIAVIGPNATEESFALTHYGPLAVDVVSALEGIQSKAEGKCNVVYSKGCELVDEKWPLSELIQEPLTETEKQQMDEALANAQQSDVVVAILGGGTRTGGENKSRTSLELPGRQKVLLQKLYETGKPVILVLINSRPLSINWADANIPAIVEAWYPGSKGGIAIADVLFGDYNPGGKLTVTFPKTVGQIPFNFPTRPYAQSNGGSKPGQDGYQTRINGPLYSFGYGLSYTSFEYNNLKLSSSVITPKQNVTISCDITNTGDVAGDEVVQLYTRDVISSIITFEKNLRGFERVHLKPGETKTVKFQIKPRDLALLNQKGDWVVEPGSFSIMVGASSVDIKLKDMLSVVEPGNIITNIRKEDISKYIKDKRVTDRAVNAIDNNLSSGWYGETGDYITLSLEKDAQPDNIEIAWINEARTAVEFAIQVTTGGGQFLTVKEGKVRGTSGLLNFKFDKTMASDIRVLITKGSGSISEIKIEQFGYNK